jgi:hypothetical protein
VDGIDTWPNGSSNPYQLSVTSTPGTTPTTVNSIKIAP